MFLYFLFCRRFVVDDEVGLTSVNLRLLHLHPRPNLFFVGRVATHRPLKADVFRGINEEDFVDIVVEAALEKDGTFEGNNGLSLFLSPKREVLQDRRMDDGIDLAGVFGIGKEVIGQELLVELLSFKHIASDECDELLANLLAFCGQPLGFLVAIIDGNAEFSLQESRDIALSATDAACYADCLQYLSSLIVNYRRLLPPAR